MPAQVSNGKMATAPSKPIKKKKEVKENTLLDEISEAIGYVINELDDIQGRLKKVEGRMGL
jgi:uncharacterized membrane protein|tara:strand:- start:858 stop:1040 length:183 start_codon:yes stop_codon:yes gene_type:complete